MSMPSQTLDGLKISSRVTLLEPGMYIFRYASQPPPRNLSALHSSKHHWVKAPSIFSLPRVSAKTC